MKNTILRRSLSFLLTLVLVLGLMPVALAQEEISAAVDEPAASAAASELLAENGPTEMPESAYDTADAIFAEISKMEEAPAKKNVSETQLSKAAEEIVKQSEGYVPGSLKRNGNVFTWETTDGISCIYNPRMREIHDEMDISEDSAVGGIYNEPKATRGGSPASKEVYVVGPYYGYDWHFTYQYRDQATAVAKIIGDTDGYTLYSGAAATVDKVAEAVSNGAIVFFDSHGATDYENPENENDFYSSATESYLCLTSVEGITDEDYADGAKYEDGVVYVNGETISNHMTTDSPSGMLWMATCLGMATDTLCEPLRTRGVEVVYGYSQTVTFGGDYLFEAAFWDKFLCGCTVAEAIASMKQEIGLWDPFESCTDISSARAILAAFPIVVSDEDTYPGQRTATSYGVDGPQTVKSTYKITPVCEENLTWNIDAQGKLTISGNGAMSSKWYSKTYVPWYSYADRITSVVIEEGVTSIGNYAFYGCTNLKTVSIPGSVTIIGHSAFYGCTELTAVVIPEGVTTIDYDAFNGCTKMTSVTIPSTVTSIGSQAFIMCSNLKGFTVSADNTVFSSDSAGCLIKNGDTLLFAPGALSGSYTVPAAVKSIYSSAFAGCSKLSEVYIHSKVYTISNKAFMNCSNLSAIYVDASNIYYSNDAHGCLFDKSKKQLYQIPGSYTGSYTVPDTVTTILTSAAEGCHSLTAVNIPASVTTIYYNAFTSSGLTEITFAGSAPQIAYSAFTDVTARVCYPAEDETYTEDVRQNYCGALTWIKSDAVVMCSDGTTYTSFAEALENYDSNSQYLILLKDQQVELTVDQDLYIDLNGHSLTGVIDVTSGQIYGMDSTTDEYTCDEIGYFYCEDSRGNPVVPLKHFKSSITGKAKRYLTVQTAEGYSFHRIYLAVTHMTVRPSVTGVGYKALFCGDEMVANALDAENAFGYGLELEGYRSVVNYKAATGFESGKYVTLRIDNYDVENHSLTELKAVAVMKLADGTVITSGEVSMTMRGLIERLNESWSTISEEQLAAIKEMIERNPIMKTWQADNLY